MNQPPQKVDSRKIRDDKIFQLTLLGHSKIRIAKELGISRYTVAEVINSIYGQKKLTEMYETVEQAMGSFPEVVGLATLQLKNVLKGECDHRKARTIIDAARLVFGVVAKFKELDRDIRAVYSETDLIESP